MQEGILAITSSTRMACAAATMPCSKICRNAGPPRKSLPGIPFPLGPSVQLFQKELQQLKHPSRTASGTLPVLAIQSNSNLNYFHN
jgi:hypothetical protein